MQATFLSHRWLPEMSCHSIILTCFLTTTITMLSIYKLVEMIRLKIWERQLSGHVKCLLPVFV